MGYHPFEEGLAGQKIQPLASGRRRDLLQQKGGMIMKLLKKVALITGAGSAIGRASAFLFTKEEPV